MKVAIDKNCINKIKDFSEYEFVYIFNRESIDELINLNLHCYYKDYIDFVDINLTNYQIECYKKANIKNKDWFALEEKKDYKFAIVIPNFNNNHGDYNGKTFLKNCIDSILMQKYKNFEIVVVDDLSTDGSVDLIKSYKSKKIHLVENIRKRYNGGSRNVGIEYALKNLDFDYFCFLDSDDWWKDNKVLLDINRKLYNHDMLLMGSEMLFQNNVTQPHINNYDCYEDVFFSINKIWCTAWCRVIRKDKIAFFPEDTLMEDRVWSYDQADNIDYDKIVNLKRVCYVWNRLNVTNSVSILRNKIWEASAWKHIGQQLMFIDRIKHKEMIPKIQERINECIEKIKRGKYEQY